MLSASRTVRVGITIGDPGGIGAEVAAQALAVFARSKQSEFTVIGEEWLFNKFLPARRHLPRYRIVSAGAVASRGFRFGRCCSVYARAAVGYLDKAYALLQADELDCIVTGPISKAALHKAGYRFGGHTEYFAGRSGRRAPVMMLLNDALCFALVTRHCALSQVGSSLRAENIQSTIVRAHQVMRDYFHIARPRLVVCGLNPHASDAGIFGDEEQRIIRPAIRRLARRIPGLCGPLAADVAIGQAVDKQFDCCIAMYHDQALIALKLTGRHRGVNLTAGLPFVRTSPLHGVAFDIAGQGHADPRSMIAAIETAIRCVQNQKKD